ncbi:MAG: tRNA (adenosine(37)-N6)-dimethylallyltransferase MiaA [Candidatus Eisenbacteria bacterium]
MKAGGRGAGPIYALVGATATGKTDLGERLATELGAEIVCADSRQVFAELDIGTGKPAARERSSRPHHLFDALSVGARPSAGWFARAATGAIEGVRAHGKAPLLVGGAGLYLRALREGLGAEPELDSQARARLGDELDALPLADLRARLERLDAVGAARIRAGDRQRMRRALEVVELSGQTLGWWQALPARPPVEGDWRVVEVRVPTAELSRRIERRTTWMFGHGLVEETRALVDGGLEPALRRLRAVGYDEALDLLAGTCTRADAETRTSQRTRQLAKRQRTWFRHQVEAGVLEGTAGADELAAQALRWFHATG